MIKKRKSKHQELLDRIEELLNSRETDQITIGQWQNKLYMLQQKYDAFRIAQASTLEVFRDFYTRERNDYHQYNEVWKLDFEKILTRLTQLEMKLAEIEINNPPGDT